MCVRPATTVHGPPQAATSSEDPHGESRNGSRSALSRLASNLVQELALTTYSDCPFDAIARARAWAFASAVCMCACVYVCVCPCVRADLWWAAFGGLLLVGCLWWWAACVFCR